MKFPIRLRLLAMTMLGVFSVAAAEPAKPDRAALAAKLESLPDSAEAKYHLGMMNRYGIGVPKDQAKAVAYFKQAQQAGDPLAAHMLGDYYQDPANGEVTPDKAEALRLKTIAAEAGYDRAQHDVARMQFEAGETDAALEWLTRAAQQGNGDALRALASLYNSDAVAKDGARTYAYYSLYLKRLAAPTEKQTAFLTEFTGTLSPDDKERGDKIVADWKAEQTPLTKKALAGLRAAEALVAAQQGSTR